MFKAVIFDMDGVLVDSELEHLVVETKLLKSIGIELEEGEHNKFVGTTANYKWSCIKEKYKIDKSIEELMKLNTDAYYDHITSNDVLKPIDGVTELVDNLSRNGFKLAVGSSSNMNAIETTLKAIKLEKYFEAVVSGQYVKLSKPEPDIFLYAADKLGVKPEECLVIEDSHNGVIAANKAGMKCLGYISEHSGNQDISTADLITDSFHKISIEDLKKLF
ncbi:haloacid dehalogenase superfamily, subfamily IA, variant 3 with third motif having DD or ED/haloacid dehalogenase superfamily, subfamily IA, variant 1 with third motif having Dx(3-4)D or Dx(3-4)E [Clostridium acidisoli DSM 12555]|uniref:Haloacid dehalogenase superfamily, subfamily IA, variant 3 with third motif having DD or ED/haloacid dehalogenase superfamily, subfamily IA, variant 1 with third motif having Dx(3-4)D or Dx(3-4)E n=1 Tax=Clostridium acidisoli DSM 12555 TaxID=1121291 RepID=A0A1W1XQ99_9CLOT|nr:HAD family phosphatase [Clostridium acidisoli]SMC25691.1 haloacid dehalogenase superfamily, subfamily IA, variant 3 with third motif having DD or ED/haloacid dehalogenase superfamily, subfamily IA, variant 1 with third motif having Dx(3-4)D or Dx(3-4)E [Clostridium acidisoli DSM 12555]